MIEIININTVDRQKVKKSLYDGLKSYHDQSSYNLWEVTDKLIRNELAWISNAKINVIGRVFERNQKRYFFVFYLWGFDLKNNSKEFVDFLINSLGCTNIEFVSNTAAHTRLYNILSKKYKSTKSLTYDMDLGYNQ